MTGASAVHRASTLVTGVLAPNPGPMTLEGTNSYVIRAPESDSVIVVDPGPDTAEHLDVLRSFGPVELIVLTHHHLDHIEGAPALAQATGAPVRAWRSSLSEGSLPLADGEVIEAAGVRMRVLHTPGHTDDSICLVLDDDRPMPGVSAEEADGGGDASPGAANGDLGGAESAGRVAPAPGHRAELTGSILTGDTILGRGTTVLTQETGAVAAYLRSLARIRDAATGALLLPAHGETHADGAAVASAYLAHRQQRLAEVEAALEDLGLSASIDPQVVAAVTSHVYPDVDPSIRFAAEASTRAQLEYLADA